MGSQLMFLPRIEAGIIENNWASLPDVRNEMEVSLLFILNAVDQEKLV